MVLIGSLDNDERGKKSVRRLVGLSVHETNLHITWYIYSNGQWKEAY